MVNAFGCEKSNESNELVTLPVIVVPFVAVVPADDGVTVTVDVFTFGFSLSPLLETPTPVTEYSHPVL